ncbi:hypothetical protein [Maridesulfovibrio sp.]|uniref:hypothetical protein n=1 Tax=Maridesulfovibrio sp. TaxID=2795000 RepID=UPI0039F06C79
MSMRVAHSSLDVFNMLKAEFIKEDFSNYRLKMQPEAHAFMLPAFLIVYGVLFDVDFAGFGKAFAGIPCNYLCPLFTSRDLVKSSRD